LLINPIRKKDSPMLRAAITFFIIGIVAMLLGLGNVAGVSVEVGKTLLFVFLVLAVISFVVSLVTGRRSGPPL
jgi:uncharacterized membrane protein YtjA (UPF0391 family)